MSRLTRRDFFRASTLAAAGAAVPRPGFAAQAQPEAATLPRVRRYKPFGKTGWQIGDISAGSGQRDPAVLDALFQRGINLIDTGQQYAGHEELIGKVLPKWRKKVFVLGKWDPPLITPTVTKSALLESLDVSLKKLNTTYIDCMMLHSIGHPRYGGIERIQNPAIYEAWDEAKRLKKVRFTGASSHGVRMIEEIGWGIDNGRFDIVLLGANFLTHGLEPLLKKARAKGVGDGRHEDDDDLQVGPRHPRAAEPADQCAAGRAEVDPRVGPVRHAGGEHAELRPRERVPGGLGDNEPERAGRRIPGDGRGPRSAPSTAGPAAAAASASCPKGVPIGDVLRYRMYFEHYGEQKFAMQRYDLVPAANRGRPVRGLHGALRADVPVRAEDQAAPGGR